jgi:predicted ribosome quality control (RQC) complex YloA/Tae2 family protein
MEIEIDFNKSVEENAGDYFEKSKKAKKKLKGALEALGESKKKLEKLKEEEEKFVEEEQKKVKKEKKKEWYEKFHWFISSEGFLCIGGKDATSNEIVVKKHAEKGDLVFHTDLPGSPFFIIKDGLKAGEETLKETAQATASYSRAWKLGLGTAEVYCVETEQVSKKAKSGEYMAKGAFMIYGKRKYFNPRLEYAIGLIEGNIFGGPVNAVKTKTNKFITMVSGREKKSALAKKIKHKLKDGELDEIIKFLPAGGGEIKK